MAFKLAYFVKLSIGYWCAKFRCYRLSGSNFIEGSGKHKYDLIMTSFNIAGIKICIFCEPEFAKILLVVWIKFYGGWYKTPITPFQYYWVFKLAYFVELTLEK